MAGLKRLITGVAFAALVSCAAPSTPSRSAALPSVCEGLVAPALLVVTGTNEDTEKFTAYANALIASGLYEQYQGYYQVLGDPVRVVEGMWETPEYLVIARFPCRAAAEAFWDSPVYGRIKPMREGAGPLRATIFEELPVPDRIDWHR